MEGGPLGQESVEKLLGGLLEEGRGINQLISLFNKSSQIGSQYLGGSGTTEICIHLAVPK